MKGITDLYYSFLPYLRTQKEKIAILQLSGKIEDFLVKEFVYHVYKSSIGINFALVNFGIKNQQKIDICLVNKKDNKEMIYGMIEAKYLRNRHRYRKSSATDEITTTLKDLNRQLHAFEKPSHGRLSVELISKTKNIYGLIFASYVTENENNELKNNFYDNILEKANINFRYHDLSRPYFRPIFDDVRIELLNSPFYVTLKAGLWKKK